MTRQDVIAKALRIIRVTSKDEPPIADDAEYVGGVLDSLLAEVGQDAPLPFDSNNIPDASFMALATYLGASIAEHFSAPISESVAKAKLRFVATIRPDDRMNVSAPEYF